MHRMNCFLSVVTVLVTCSLGAASPLSGTTTYEPPVEITPADTHYFGKHAVTRLVDWDDDLLIGGGDGRVWLILNLGEQQFTAPVAIQAKGKGTTTRLGIAPVF